MTGVLPLTFESVKSVFGGSKVPNTSEISNGEDVADLGDAEIADPKKADLTLLETAMEFSTVSPDELNAYLRGNNPKGKKFISDSQTYKDLDPSILAKIAEEKNWEKVEAFISERRAK